MRALRIEAIVTDLDDTLFDGEGKISDYTLETMRECTRRGVRVIPASGRAQASMERFVRQLDTGLPYIACNGSQLVRADHTVMETSTIPTQLAREVCAFLQQNGCYVQIYKDEFFYYSEECAPARAYKKSSGMAGVAVGSLMDYLTFPVPKILSVNDPEKIARLYPLANELFEGRVTFTVSKPYFLEVEPKGVSKGEALRKLAKLIDLKPESAMVFGDSLNDVSMFGFTANSVAMGNARDEVKKAARFICGPNTEDGLARFVRENVLTPITGEATR